MDQLGLVSTMKLNMNKKTKQPDGLYYQILMIFKAKIFHDPLVGPKIFHDPLKIFQIFHGA